MEMHAGIGEQYRQEISEGLARFLADLYATYLKTQNYHWNLTGGAFYSLHLLFEKQYEDLAEAVDEVAERIRALGFYVDASFSAFREKTRIPDDSKILVINEMLQQLISAHEMVCRHGRTVVRLAEKGEDAGTVDLLGRRLASHEKMIWMLRSSLE
jgi:starvation-inducible DNA-binding protein